MVSIIMPTYNRGYIISRAIENVLQQTYMDWELIIVDDGSTDNTAEVVEKYLSEKVRYIRYVQNRGGNHARNIGIREARGEYLSFLDTDNEWVPEALEHQMELMTSMTGTYKFITGVTKFIDTNGVTSTNGIFFSEYEIDREYVLKKSFSQAHSIMDMNTYCISRNCIDRVGGFDENLRRLQDWGILIRLLSDKEVQYAFLDEIISVNSIQANSISKKPELLFDARMHIIRKYAEVFRAYDGLLEAIYTTVITYIGIHGCLEKSQEKIIYELLDENEKEQLISLLLASREKMLQDANWYFDMMKKNELILIVQNKWLELYRTGDSIVSRLKKRGINSVAIYGYGVLGRFLYKELLSSEISVKYLIDQNAKKNCLNSEEGIETECITNEPVEIRAMEKVEAIIVTAVFTYEDIKDQLSKHTETTIVSLAELVS